MRRKFYLAITNFANAGVLAPVAETYGPRRVPPLHIPSENVRMTPPPVWGDTHVMGMRAVGWSGRAEVMSVGLVRAAACGSL